MKAGKEKKGKYKHNYVRNQKRKYDEHREKNTEKK